MRGALLSGIIVSVLLGGCTAAPAEPTSTPAATAPAPSPSATPEPTEPECLTAPSEFEAIGAEVVGCILESKPNSFGGTTFRAAVTDLDDFDVAKVALEAAGLDITVCSLDPRRCGFSSYGESINVSLLYIPVDGGTYDVPVLEYTTLPSPDPAG